MDLGGIDSPDASSSIKATLAELWASPSDALDRARSARFGISFRGGVPSSFTDGTIIGVSMRYIPADSIADWTDDTVRISESDPELAIRLREVFDQGTTVLVEMNTGGWVVAWPNKLSQFKRGV